MHMIKQDQSKVRSMDLLWRYYEKNRSFGKAAHVLARLADMHRCVMMHFSNQCPNHEYTLLLSEFKWCMSTALRSHYSRDWSTSPGPSFQPRVHPVSPRWEPTESSCMNWKRRWRYWKSVHKRFYRTVCCSGNVSLNILNYIKSSRLCGFRCRSRRRWEDNTLSTFL